MIRRLLLLIVLPFFSGFVGAQTQKVFLLELMDEVNPSTARYIKKGMEAAHKAKADLILLHLDTYGGLVNSADSIRSTLLDSRIPTAVFIDKNAASAGALISLSCDSIYMAPGASIGAATVVNGGTQEAAPDKYQSYFRGMMRATAERKGRDPKIAEKMVDQNLELEGISPKGQVITFTTQEAISYDYADAEAENISQVLQHLGKENAELVAYDPGIVDGLIGWLINPAVSSFLVLMIFGGLFFEMKSPGVGFPGLVALAGIVLFFAPHYLEGLAAYWEIGIFVLGVALIAAEIFVIPGFGVPGILGILLVLFSLSFSFLYNNGLDFTEVSWTRVLRALAIVTVSMATAILLVVWLARHLLTGKKAHPFVDDTTQDSSLGYTAVSNDLKVLVGKIGIAVTDLRPSGYIEIDGKKLDGEALQGFIPKGQEVKIHSIRSINLMVEPI